MGIWPRGILSERHGVDIASIRWGADRGRRRSRMDPAADAVPHGAPFVHELDRLLRELLRPAASARSSVRARRPASRRKNSAASWPTQRSHEREDWRDTGGSRHALDRRAPRRSRAIAVVGDQPLPSFRRSAVAFGYEWLSGSLLPANLQGFREIGSSCERSNLLVLVPGSVPDSAHTAAQRGQGGDVSASARQSPPSPTARSSRSSATYSAGRLTSSLLAKGLRSAILIPTPPRDSSAA